MTQRVWFVLISSILAFGEPPDQAAEVRRKWLIRWDSALAQARALPPALAGSSILTLANMLPEPEHARKILALRQVFDLADAVTETAPTRTIGGPVDSLEGYLSTRMATVDRQSLKLKAIQQIRKIDGKQAMVMLDRLTNPPQRDLACSDGAIPQPDLYYRELFEARKAFPTPVLGREPFASFLRRKLQPTDLYSIAAMLTELPATAGKFSSEEYQAVLMTAAEALRKLTPSPKATTVALRPAIRALRSLIRVRGAVSWPDEELALALRDYIVRSTETGVCGGYAYQRVEGRPVPGFLLDFNGLAADLQAGLYRKATALETKDLIWKVGQGPRYREFWLSARGARVLTIMQKLNAKGSPEAVAKLIEQGLMEVRQWQTSEEAEGLYYIQRAIAANALAKSADTLEQFQAAARLSLDALLDAGFKEQHPGIWHVEAGALLSAKPAYLTELRQLLTERNSLMIRVLSESVELYQSRPSR